MTTLDKISNLTQLINDMVTTGKIDPQLRQGILFDGQVGCGQFFTAKQIAANTGCNLESLECNDIFGNTLGEGPAAINMLFKNARKSAPSIVVIENFDILMPSDEHSPDDVYEVEKTNIRQALVYQMAKFSASAPIVVIATTHRDMMLADDFNNFGYFKNTLTFTPNALGIIA